MGLVWSDERAVSESLGYILIFGVVVAGIAMVFLIGSHIIDNTQESASYQGLEQSFQVIGTDLRSTAFGESPIMTTRVKIDYGTLCLFPEDMSGSEIAIYGNDKSDLKYYQPIGVLTFNSQTYGKSITMENGAMVEMQDGDGANEATMSLEPRIFYSSSTKTLMVTVINLKCDETSYSGGIVNIQTEYLNNALDQYDGLSSAEICVRTNYTGAWKNYLLDSMPEITKSIDNTGDPGNWTNVTFNGVNKLVVVTYNIGASI